MNKPIVFNYGKYKELRSAYKQLLEDNVKLKAENKRLEKQNAYLKANLAIEGRKVNDD